MPANEMFTQWNFNKNCVLFESTHIFTAMYVLIFNMWSYSLWLEWHFSISEALNRPTFQNIWCPWHKCFGIFLSSLILDGWAFWTLFFIMFHTFSMRLRSEEFPGCSNTGMSLSLSRLVTSLVLCAGAPSCIKWVGWWMRQKSSQWSFNTSS